MESTDHLKSDLEAALRGAMREGATETRDTLRMLLAAIKQVEIDQQIELDDEGVIAVIAKQAKQRRESIADAEAAGRPDLAEAERRELVICETYLPKMLTADDIEPIAQEVIDELGATGMQDMGRVMGTLMPRLQGRAEGGVVSGVVRSLLQS